MSGTLFIGLCILALAIAVGVACFVVAAELDELDKRIDDLKRRIDDDGGDVGRT